MAAVEIHTDKTDGLGLTQSVREALHHTVHSLAERLGDELKIAESIPAIGETLGLDVGVLERLAEVRREAGTVSAEELATLYASLSDLVLDAVERVDAMEGSLSSTGEAW